MTEQELQSVINAVLSSIKTNSRSIGQLTGVQTLSDSDCFEVAGGRKIAYSVLRDLIFAAANTKLENIQTDIANSVLQSVSFDVTGNTATLTIKQKGYDAITVSVPIATDSQSGIMTAADKDKLDSTYSKQEIDAEVDAIRDAMTSRLNSITSTVNDNSDAIKKKQDKLVAGDGATRISASALSTKQIYRGTVININGTPAALPVGAYCFNTATKKLYVGAQHDYAIRTDEVPMPDDFLFVDTASGTTYRCDGTTLNNIATPGADGVIVVNNLTEGGTDVEVDGVTKVKVLSAEMGKVLNNKLSIEGNDIIPTASTLNYYFINASAKWQSYVDVTSKLVPITPNKSYNIYAQSSGTSHISVLSQDNHMAQNPAFATGFTARIGVSNGNVYHLDAPSDANYILITSGTFAGSVYPSKIVEVGSKFDGIDSQIEGLDERLGAVEKMDINGKVDRSFQQITLKRSTNIFVSVGNIGSDGKPIDTSSPFSKYTPFIPILGGSQLTYYLDRRDAAKYVAFYSSASTDGFISATAVTSLTVKTIDVPETAKYFRTSSRVDDATYDPYVTFICETTGKDVGEIKDALGISSSETVLYGKDITDNGTVGSLNTEGAVHSADTNWRVTDFIHAKCGTTIRWASGYSRLCFYSSASESSFLFAISSSSTEKQFLVPFGTDYYFRVALTAGDTTTYVGYYKDDSSVVNAINEKIQPLSINAKWLSLGTSITWYNNHLANGITKGYQTRVMEVLKFNEFVNNAVNGGSMVGLASALSNVVSADYVTIEHGVNDWMQGQSVGTIDDFISDTGAGTFCGAYRKVIDKVYELNPSAQIIICTPRKAYGFNDSLPSHWYDIKNGKHLKDYADAAIEIARFMSLPICDWFNESGMNQNNLAANSIDVALHPNDEGFQKMANLLVQTFKKILPYE